ncbi:putative F420-dependent oxidoreductase [Tamaricihabitans halophyticus]|uniref:Putative F420-dependent oxidoreductase n=1 Tax=Tamaricihabitans halophyticus TaxID=1262583 RepID=A0A4R2QWQ9_9PSEU|nr:LLM class F420-dependent oxidoreductase [Tamaricihabitans halophyticus]TCP54147.1 putative F420-dependent oxidoreductase [Tamaricihabitans halophyticus]
MTSAMQRYDLGRVGIWSGAPDWSRPEAADVAAELDELGFGALWLGLSRADLAVHERLLAATSRLTLATGIVNIWTEPSAQVVGSYHRVVTAYPDRLLLGLGSGHKVMVEAMTSYTYERPYSALASYVDELDSAETPVPKENRVLAALGPRTLRLAGARSAGAHPYLSTAEHTRTAREILGPEPLLAPELKVVLDADPTRARATARAGVGPYLQLPNYTNNLLRLGFSVDDFADGGSDRLIDALVGWGKPDAVRAKIAEHHDAGADHVCVQVLSDSAGPPVAGYRALAEALA